MTCEGHRHMVKETRSDERAVKERESKEGRTNEQAASTISGGLALRLGIGILLVVPMANIGAGVLFGITLGMAFGKAFDLLPQVQQPKWLYGLVGILMILGLIGLVYLPVQFTKDW